jgi:hypothetical protein
MATGNSGNMLPQSTTCVCVCEEKWTLSSSLFVTKLTYSHIFRFSQRYKYRKPRQWVILVPDVSRPPCRKLGNQLSCGVTSYMLVLYMFVCLNLKTLPVAYSVPSVLQRPSVVRQLEETVLLQFHTVLRHVLEGLTQCHDTSECARLELTVDKAV